MPPCHSLFVPHCAPTFALHPGAAGAALNAKARQLPKPRAIIISSAHWSTAVPTLGSAGQLETIHDFSGFPDELYKLSYPARGCREAVEEVVAAISRSGMSVRQDGGRGLDHGAWVPLRLMYPDADIPVIPLSIQRRGGPQEAYRLGQALAPLATEGFLVIASGNITHNLGDYRRAARTGQETPSYVRQFADWIADRLQSGSISDLLGYRTRAPGAHLAHPDEDHLLPLFIALGSAGETVRAERFHAGVEDYVLATDAWAFSPAS